jgi:hypothetical protein
MFKFIMIKVREHLLFQVAILWICCFFLCFFVAYVGCRMSTLAMNSMFSGLDCPEGRADPSRLAHLTRSKIPSSASNIDSYQIGGAMKYCRILVRFDIAPSDLNGFLASTRINLPLTRQSASGNALTFNSKDLWTPKPGATYLYGHAPAALDYNQTIFVDTNNPQRYTIFMIADHEYLS